MRLAFWRNWSLAAQLTLMMATLVAIAVLAITTLYINREQGNMRRELERQAEVILLTLTTTQANALYMLDTNALETSIESFGAANTGVQVRVYDDGGRLVADSSLDQALTFGLEADPFAQELIDSGGLITRWTPEYLEAGQQVTVGRRVIGAFSLQVSSKDLAVQLQTAQNQGLLLAAVAVAAGAGASLIVSRAITRPLQAITNVAQRISEGDLSTRAVSTSQKEMNQLATTFNEMIDAIQKREADLRKQAEELRVAVARAKEAARLKGEFLATVSHELRTPLNAIIGFSDMLLAGMSGPLNEKQEHKITRLKENGARLLALINDLLDITRIEAGRLETVEKPYSPRAMTERVAAQMESLAEKNKLQFKLNISPDLPENLIGDEKRVEQVIVNLISNAVKFTPKGSVSLDVETDLDQKKWKIMVSDTGIGIPPHARDLIFEQFRQVDGSYTRTYRGSGLGLAISRDLVRMMNGQIGVESELDVGSTFTVTLPLNLPDSESTPELEVAIHV